MRKPSPAMIVALLGLFVALGGVGVAATGGNFILGQANTATTQSSLTAPVAGGKALQLTNADSSTAASTALGLSVAAGHPPFTVNSATKVTFLNSDLIDGLDSSAFLRKGASNSASTTSSLSAPVVGGRSLLLVNTDSTNAASTALALSVAAGHPPFTVNSAGKVVNLNADRFDGLDSTAFLRNVVPLALSGATASDGVISATNTGTANGLQGITSAAGASGVYGENDGAGFAVAGRANASGGVGVYAESLGGGPALAIHTAGAPPMSVDSSAKVVNLNADKVDGASILSNRIISTTPNDHIIQLPGFGDFNVVSCDHTNAVFQWSSGGPVAYVTWWDDFNATDSFLGVANIVTANARPHHFATVQLARGTGGSTSIATITVTTNGADCVFAAQAVVQPG